MWEGAADAAPVEIDNPALLSQGENQAPAKRIAALIADQPRAQQQIKGIAESGQLPPEITAGSIAEFHVFNQPGITDSSLPQILGRFRMTVKLRLVKAGGVVEQLGVVSESEAVLQAWATVYRDPAKYWPLYELAEKLIDFEDYFRRWRFNHVTTVERVIGLKRGTGGTSGVSYLRRMLDVVLFPELWKVRTEM